MIFKVFSLLKIHADQYRLIRTLHNHETPLSAVTERKTLACPHPHRHANNANKHQAVVHTHETAAQHSALQTNWLAANSAGRELNK